MNFNITKITRGLVFAGLMSASCSLMAEAVDGAEEASVIIAPKVVVTGTRVEQNSFDLPMSIDSTD
ncbi:MAG TPA: hypothetical protein PKL58_08350, partial [Methylophilaceae bacterium]|nr:hypothetical protein [Methylophilaceae bacterium]